MKKSRVLALACSSFLAISLVLSGIPTAQPAAAATAFRVHTWNLAMGNSGFRKYNETIAATVAYVQTYPAWQLSLQESCRGQMDSIAWQLNATGAGFTQIFGTSSSGSESCPPGLGPYGNAVFNIGAPVPPQFGGRWYWLNPHGPTAEDRNAVCGMMQSIGFRYMGCSLHLTPDDSYALPQMVDAWNRIRAQASGEGALSVVAGDFNVEFHPTTPLPWQAAQWFYTHDEAWMPYARATYTTNGINGTMIDWEFADRARIRQWGRYLCSFYLSYSDHGLCPAVFLIT